MGARGPLKKDDGERQGRQQPVQGQVFDQAPEIPSPPKGLHESVEADWAEFWQSAVARVLSDSDVPAVRRLFRYRSEWQEIDDELEGKALSETLVEGSTGQLRSHPLVERQLKLETTIAALEDKLGLTPMARARLGIAIGVQKLTWDQVAKGGQAPSTPLAGDVLDTKELGV